MSLGHAGGCDSQMHGKHMCELKKSGCSEEIQKLATMPKFKCGNCGAQAAAEENLCKPEPM